MTGEVVWVKDVGGRPTAGIKTLDIHNDDESRFLLQLCDCMGRKLNTEYPSIGS